ncbi:MAG TPA: DUF1206 domain-containing protein [Steroidobacteraceae bacterium]|jgi:hypothetical protein|nr:DUF1206 domain-containing protein [Steroidobacteraceae bacterium]
MLSRYRVSTASGRGYPNDGHAQLAPWLEWLGHIGYVAEGAVYLLVGVLAQLASFDRSRQPNSYKGALSNLAGGAFGDTFLILLVVGLTAFVVWQLIMGVLDPEHRRTRQTIKRRVHRLGHLFNGVFHATWVGEAALPLLGLGSGEDHGRAQAQWIHWVLALPPGRWIVATTGVVIVVFGMYQFYLGISRNKLADVDLTHKPLRICLGVLGFAGFMARTVLFALIGRYLIDAARRYDAHDATGVAGALGALRAQPYGLALLGVVAAGLICYGSFLIFKEPYRTFRAD